MLSRAPFLLSLLCAVAFLAGVSGLAAEPSAASGAQVPDPVALLGVGLAEALERFGAPAEVSVLRGEEPWQDDVVFSYASGLHLFWYQNAVWQVRLDVRWAGEVLQLRMGAARQRVRELLGPPWREEEDALVYHLEDRGYPVRLRLYFAESLLVDAYCYRGDL
ncbi:MAG: hypothetical protein JW820_20615 [Spirochaetales bacterium]|nr:hypothetical protein [Spirochaetales bacterium]